MATSIARLTALSDTERAAIVAPLDEFSRARGFPFVPQSLALGLSGMLRFPRGAGYASGGTNS